MTTPKFSFTLEYDAKGKLTFWHQKSDRLTADQQKQFDKIRKAVERLCAADPEQLDLLSQNRRMVI